MTVTSPSFTLGVEEEYLLVDQECGELAVMPKDMMQSCKAELGDQVSHEFLRCQIEVGTPVCADLSQVREHLSYLRRTVAHHADRFGLAPISVACHPWADWRDQDQTDQARYDSISRQMGLMARRMLICGMHVHVGIEDRNQRIRIMNQMVGFLPLLLALSGSSPFWLGEDTRMSSYRTTVFSGYPRTGFPPVFSDWADYDAETGRLCDMGIISNTTKIWWDLRPSGRFPTLETRICDACPRLEETLTLTAMIQATIRMLWRLDQSNIGFQRMNDLFLQENRWRAARYGIKEGLINAQEPAIQSISALVMEWQELIREDAQALGCLPEVERLTELVEQGNASARQRVVFTRQRAAGLNDKQAYQKLVKQLIQEFAEDHHQAPTIAPVLAVPRRADHQQ